MEHDPWGAPAQIRETAADVRGSLVYVAGYQAGLSRAPGQRRRWVRSSLRVLVHLAVAAALFFGGWLSHGVFLGGASSTPPTDEVSAVVLPDEGVTLNAHWGETPRRLVQEGVIDLEKFEAAARAAGLPLSPEQLEVLREDSDAPIRVDAGNAYFVLNVMWALGLANSNAILTQGAIGQYEKPGDLASTGGWSLGVKPGPEYLAALELVTLTPEQQNAVSDVARDSYRPCCGNMTAFPDCNHGMAALGLAELMASQGASAGEIFQALKDISPFWFPTQYHHLALYFQSQGQQWDQVDARTLMGKEYSSASGWKQVAARLQQQGALEGGPGGGKESGCSP